MADPDLDDLEAICAVLRDGSEPLTEAEVSELRRILAPFHSQAAGMTLDQLVHTGYFLVGLYAPASWDDPVEIGVA